MILTRVLTFNSEGEFYGLNITDDVRAVLQESGVTEGSVLVYYRHTTGAILIVEHEVGILVDLQDVLDDLAPVARAYKHHLRGYDSNGAAHVRTAMLNVSVTIPVTRAELMIGSYQEIIMLDLDQQSGPRLARPRQVVVQVSGE
jgi:secondary thiamine-phosphate synthase enzyme